jgi:signal transduction histidine kinase
MVHPSQLRGHGAAATTALFAVPSLVLVAGVVETSMSGAVRCAGIVSCAMVLGAAILTYFHWRLSSAGGADQLSSRLAAWLTVGLTLGAVDGLFQVTSFSDAPSDGPGDWAMVCHVALLLMLCAAASIAERVELPTDPALVAAAGAAAIAALNVVAEHVAPPLAIEGVQTALLLNAALTMAGLILVWTLLNLVHVSMWARRRLAVSVLLISAARCADNLDRSPAVVMAGAVAAYVLGAVMLCVMTAQLLRHSVLAHQAELHRMQQTLAEMRATALEDRELLHEVGATLAGITTASEVMRQGRAVPVQRRRRLESMLDAELGRLGRLLVARAEGPDHTEDREIEVDAVVEHLVISHQARGRAISWRPSGQRAMGDADELAEVLNILLENAAKHGGGSPIMLSTSVVDEVVVVICSDAGPGVPADLRDRIFDVEVGRPGSPGQGLGLAIAHRLVTARGGSLELVDHELPGATFVARLPGKEMADDEACHVA